MSKKRRRRRKQTKNWFMRLSMIKRVLLIVSAVFICVLATGAIYVAAQLGKVEREDIPKKDIIVNDLSEEVGEGYTNFVLFGGDSRVGELEEGVRTDSIIIASLNNKTKEVKMVSVYRDTLLDMTDGSLKKCNSAYSEGGPEQAINMLNMNLDLEIEDYVTVDFSVVSNIVDAVGGIEVDIQEEEISEINKYIGETAKVAQKVPHKIEQAGLQTLDGVQATTYSRIRKGVGDDYKRTERQRLVISKVAEKLIHADLLTINTIIDAVFPTIKTSMSMGEILSYVKDIQKYTIGEAQGFPVEHTGATIPGKGSCVIPNTLESNVKDLHKFLYGTEDYQPSSKVGSISSQIQSEVGSLGSDSSSGYSENSGQSTDWYQDDYEDDDTGTYNSNQGSSSNTQTPAVPEPEPTPLPEPDPGDSEGNTSPDGNGGTTDPGGNEGTTTPGGDSGTTTPGGDTGAAGSGDSGETVQ